MGYLLQAESLSTELQQRAPEAAALQEAIQERQQKMSGLEKTINDVKDGIYAPLSKQVWPLSCACMAFACCMNSIDVACISHVA